MANGGIWGDGQRGGIFGARVDPLLVAELERRAVEKRQMAQGLESAAAADTTIGSRALDWWNSSTLGRMADPRTSPLGPAAIARMFFDPAGEAEQQAETGRQLAQPFTQFNDPNVSPVKQGADLALTAMGGSSVVPAEANSLRMGIKAYHGSPHDFDEFSMDHSRAGNYGDAAYFHTAKEDADRYNFRPHGKTYEADLNLNRTFDMKKEISADDAAAILEGIGNKEMADQVRKSGRGFRTGSELWYWGMGQSMPAWQKAKAVKNAGFDSIIGDPGQEIAGKSTRSPEIAVFDANLIAILKKYGLPISAAGLAALSQLHPQEAQAAQKQKGR